MIASMIPVFAFAESRTTSGNPGRVIEQAKNDVKAATKKRDTAKKSLDEAKKALDALTKDNDAYEKADKKVSECQNAYNTALGVQTQKKADLDAANQAVTDKEAELDELLASQKDLKEEYDKLNDAVKADTITVTNEPLIPGTSIVPPTIIPFSIVIRFFCFL